MQIDRRVSSRERRRAARAPLTAAVVQRSGGATRLAQASNIGELGMTVRYVGDGGPAHLPRTPVAIAFQLPGGDRVIEARAEVIFDRSDGVYRTAGLRFARMAPSAAREIARFVEAPRGV